jgi:hypothetical protein
MSESIFIEYRYAINVKRRATDAVVGRAEATM